MNSEDRLKALFLVWIAFAVAVVATFSGRDLDGGAVAIAFIFMVAAAASTAAITDSGSRSKSGENAKRKHEELAQDQTTFVDRLLESMSDDERAALYRRLSDGAANESSSDGEYASLDELLQRK